MAENIMNITQESFDQEVLSSDQLVIVDFYADWCMPCRMLAPIMEEVADKNAGQAKIVKLNVDNAPAISQQYRVMSIPTIGFFKGGKEVNRVVGLRDADDIQEMIESYK